MIFGLFAALGWGLADFFGALAGRRIGSVSAVVAASPALPTQAPPTFVRFSRMSFKLTKRKSFSP